MNEPIDYDDFDVPHQIELNIALAAAAKARLLGNAMTAQPNAYDLLLAAPDQQVTRCKLAWKAVAAGEWLDAMHFLRNAAREEAGTAWAKEAEAMASACARNVNPYRLVAENPAAAK